MILKERKKKAIPSYAKEKGYGEAQIITDIGSGLNGNRETP